MTEDELVSTIRRVRGLSDHTWLDIVRVALHAEPVKTRKMLARMARQEAQVALTIQQLVEHDLGVEA